MSQSSEASAPKQSGSKQDLTALRKLLTDKKQHLHLPKKAALIRSFLRCCLCMVMGDKSQHSSALEKAHSNNLPILIILSAQVLFLML